MILPPHPPHLRAAAEALVRGSRLPLRRIAAEIGIPAGTLTGWSRRGGWRKRASPGRRGLGRASGESLSGPALRAALRGHVARQIARLDAALEGDALPDSARVLRDLGGLKRLLDELAAGEAGGRDAPGCHAGNGHGGAGGRRGDDAGDPDLPALRAQIARRYEAFAGERADGGLPGEPAGPAPGGALD